MCTSHLGKPRVFTSFSLILASPVVGECTSFTASLYNAGAELGFNWQGFHCLVVCDKLGSSCKFAENMGDEQLMKKV